MDGGVAARTAGRLTGALLPALVLTAGLLGCSSSSSGGGGAAAAGAQSGGTTTTPPALTFTAGAAAIDCTPPAGSPLAGFGGTPRRVMNVVTIPLQISAVLGTCFDPDPSDEVTFFGKAQGALDPIMVRALVLSNGQTKAAIVKIDAIGAARDLHDDIVAEAATLGIPAENVILCATHTHSGPGAMSHWRLWQVIAADCFNQNAYDRMKSAALQALRTADASARPAEIGIGKTFETDASRNRRGRPGVYDPEVGIIKVVEAGTGAPIAAVVNFAVHGTAYGQSNMLFTADLMGVAEREIEQGLGGGVAIFTNGAEGDVSPNGGMGAGTKIANTFLSAWPGVAVKPWVELAGAMDDCRMPAPTYNTGCLPMPGSSKTLCDFIPGFSLQIPLDSRWLPSSAPVKALRIDRTCFPQMPGEAITEIGWDLKARAAQKGFDQGFVIGLANEHLSYITTTQEYVRGEYEGASTIYGPYTGDTLVRALDAVMDRVKP